MRQPELALTTRHVRASPHGFQKLRRGIHVEAGTWAANYSERRHYLRALAVALAADSPPVYSHTTAAGAGWDIPLYRVSDRAVHVIDPDEHPANRAEM